MRSTAGDSSVPSPASRQIGLLARLTGTPLVLALALTVPSVPMVAAGSVLSTIGNAVHTSVAGAAVPGQGSPFDCSGPTMYTIQIGNVSAPTGGTLYAVDTSTIGHHAVTDTPVSTQPAGTNNFNPNALAITKGGESAYMAEEPVSGGTTSILAYDTGTQSWSTFTGTASPGSIVAGAIDPSSGIYYYALYAGGRATIFGFNTTTNTAISGVIATTSLPTGGTGTANGDFAFDQAGDFYLIDSSGTQAALGVVDGPLPTTGTTNGASLSDTTLSTYSDPAAFAYNGIAFDNFGHLYLQYSSGTAENASTYLLEVNPNTGDVVSGPTQQGITGEPGVDLAACQLNPTLLVKKDIVSRVSPTDQFGLSVTGGGLTLGNTAMTTGSSTGVQSVVAGPVIGVSGTTYTVAETATSQDLADYSTTYRCTDAADGHAVIASGSAQSFTLPFPNPGVGDTGPFVTCTFTNTADPTLSLTKALSGDRVHAGDQFTVQIHSGHASGPVVNDTAHATTKGTGSTITSGSGTTGTYVGRAGTTYSLTEVADSGTLADYTPSMSCSDAHGVESGLPTEQPFDGSLPITLVTGAAVSCVLTNQAVANPVPGLTIVKSAAVDDVNADGKTDLGDTISWHYAVTNTGNVTLHDVGVNDVTAGAVRCPDRSLAPGHGEICTATSSHTITQSDVDAGVVDNTATAHGTAPGSRIPTVSGPSSTTTPIDQRTGITVVKSATEHAYSAPGQRIDYVFLVTNTGTVTLSAITIDDPLIGLTGLGCPHATLAPGMSERCAATYLVTQADMSAGSIVNRATAQGLPSGSLTPVVSTPSSFTLDVAAAPALTIVKSANVDDVNADGKTDLGDTIAWTYVVTNTGNVTLSQVGVNDPAAGAVHCLFTTLAPGAFETCTADTLHTVSEADVDAGVIDNTATAQGSASRSSAPTTSTPSSTSTPVVQVSGISLTKSALEHSYSALGQTIHYTFMVANTGTVTLSHVGIRDHLSGLVGPSCPTTTMAPAASQRCTATYAVTRADMDARTIVNQATAQGDPPGSLNPVVSQPSSVTTPLASIAIVKQVCASTSAQGCGQGGAGPWESSTTISPGSTAYWRIMVTNTGRIDLHGVTIADSLEPSCGLAGGTISVAVGASVGIYCATPSVSASLDNVATADFSGSGAAPVTSSAQINVALSPSATSTGPLAVTGIASLDAKIGGGIAAIFVGLWCVALSHRRRPRRAVPMKEHRGEVGDRRA